MKADIEILKTGENTWEVRCLTGLAGKIEKDKYNVWWTAEEDYSMDADMLEALAEVMRGLK